MIRFLLLFISVLATFFCKSQLISGPMLGPVELREARIWIGLGSADDKAQLRMNAEGSTAQRVFSPQIHSTYEFNTVVFVLGGLEPATSYQYVVSVTGSDGKLREKKGSFTTKTLFQWRSPAPDFSFLTGSCAYFNEPRFDRPGTPYGQDSSIFETMAKEKSAFMLWLGDNWYTREADYLSRWGLWYRAWHDRSQPVLQPFLSSMGHLAIWDDHDYGPNDYGKSFHLKQTSRNIFSAFWLNPSYGEGSEGIYSRYQYSDVDFFMLDDRWWRDYEKLPDSVNGLPNPDKLMLGRQQMEWLKNELRLSQANTFTSFRVIAIGSQVLNPPSTLDKLLGYPAEYYELINFIRTEKIEGVVFLTGDRHHTEIIRVKYEGMYPLYDITCSPLTSGNYRFKDSELNNPWRVLGVDSVQNYGRISFSGEKGRRKMKVEIVGIKGELLGSWGVGEEELKMTR